MALEIDQDRAVGNSLTPRATVNVQRSYLADARKGCTVDLPEQGIEAGDESQLFGKLRSRLSSEGNTDERKYFQ